MGGKVAIERWISVCRRAENVAISVESKAPRVVVELVKELQSRAIWLETKNALPELKVLAANVSAEVRITDRAIEPVVEAAPEIALHRVRVAGAPARKNCFAHVGLVVAIGVFEKEHLARFGHNDAAVHEHQRGREIQFVGEDRELVGLAVSIGVLANLDIGLAGLAFAHKTVWII